MTTEKEYFLHLLACFLGGEEIQPRQVDWQVIFQLADQHNVQAIIAHQASTLPAPYAPTGQIKSFFNQQIGRTLQNYDVKQKVKAKIHALLDKSDIDHVFVKGSALRQYYPVPEFRTSGDIDVILRPADYHRMVELLESINCSYTDLNNVTVLHAKGTEVEIHSNANIDCPYFSDLFAIGEDMGEHLYQIDMYDHILYVLRHICKHIKSTGAGVRMLMDMDVLIRNIDDFDQQELNARCEKAGYAKSWQAIASLLALWFHTPIEPYIDLGEDTALLSNFETVFLDGGVFGFEQFDLGDYYISKSVGDSDKLGFWTRIKALLHLFFPPVETLTNSFAYADRHRILVPVAYFHKLFLAVFTRFGHSRDTINAIMHNDSDVSIVYRDLLEELEISK